MLEKIRQTVQNFGMLNPGERVIVAVSGGPDSVALLQVLVLLSSEYDLILTVAHVNHGLRGAESDAEEQLVRRLSREKGISCVVKRVDLHALRKGMGRKRSLEDIGREERYRFFSALAAQIGASRIALGHHREDQAETVLMNLIRGSGLEGLKGILPVRDERFIRPLLEVSRKDILDFLQAEQLPFLEDSSNSQDLYLRNRIRHQLIPLLQEKYNPQILNTLNRVAGIVRREDAFLKSSVDRILDEWQIPPPPDRGEMAISIPEIQKLPEALQYRVIKTLLERCILSPHRVSSRHIQAVINLCQGSKPRGFLFLPGNVVVKREYDKLTLAIKEKNLRHGLYCPMKERTRRNFSYPIDMPGLVEIEELGKVVKTAFAEKGETQIPGREKNSAYLDFDKVHPPLVIRSRREGDRFQPLGMTGTKKIKAYFIDEKVPRWQRDLIPLLADRHSVVWVAGLRLSERVRVEDKTRRIIKIEII